MSTLKYNIVTDDGDPSSITVFHEGRALVATVDHVNFGDIVDKVDDPDANDQDVVDLFDLAVPIKAAFTYLSERVTVNAGRIFFDGDEVHNSLTEAIVAFYVQGNKSFEPLVAFMEKIETNPNQHSKESLFRWLSNKSFAIHPDGDIVGYKGVNRASGLGDEVYESSSMGTAMVNGVVVHGHIPTSPDTIVEMPRSSVQHDPRAACSTGLHVGTWNYARGFGQVTLRVKVNPRDVVSVPTDAGDAKMRVCRYRVMQVVTGEDKSMLFPDTELRTLFTGSAATTKNVKVGINKSSKAKAKKATAKKVTKAPAKKAAPVKKATIKKATAKRAAKAPAKKVAVTKAPARKLPKYYEDFMKADFETRPYNELRWLAGEWEVATSPPLKKPDLVKALANAAAGRRRRKTVKYTGKKS